MGDYLATIGWRGGEGFREGRYSRAHDWSFDGGARVRASSSPHVVPAPFSDPAAVDPEEALVAATSSCHMLWFLHLARDAGFEVASYRDEARGRMGKGAGGETMITRIELRPQVEWAGEAPGEAALARLHADAHARCFIANSLKSEVVLAR